MRSWLEISESALAHNLRILRSAAGEDTELLAVVKANAYGHGAELCATTLARAGARWLGVTDAEEGARVRTALTRAGFGDDQGENPEIVVMCGSLAEEVSLIAEHRLIPVVWTLDQISTLHNVQQRKVHIEVDTGMSRQGARPGPELDAVLIAVKAAGLTLDGVFTHLCSSELADSSLTLTQAALFEKAVEQVRVHALQPRWLHAANSSAIDAPSPPISWLHSLAATLGARPMVRAGLALYGYLLPDEQATCDADAAPRPEPQLRPHLRAVLTWRARILAVRDLAHGDTVGYGATFTAPARMRVALLPVGYSDGLRRELSNPSPNQSERAGGWVIASLPDGRLHRCPIVGRVSMNLTVVDISGAPALEAGDVVTLLGDGVTAEDHARIARTIAYEILCGVSAPHRLRSA